MAWLRGADDYDMVLESLASSRTPSRPADDDVRCLAGVVVVVIIKGMGGWGNHACDWHKTYCQAIRRETRVFGQGISLDTPLFNELLLGCNDAPVCFLLDGMRAGGIKIILV